MQFAIIFEYSKRLIVIKVGEKNASNFYVKKKNKKAGGDVETFIIKTRSENRGNSMPLKILLLVLSRYLN